MRYVQGPAVKSRATVDSSAAESSYKVYRGYSSAGRAVALQAKGRQFDPDYLHQIKSSRGTKMTPKETLDKAYGNVPKEPLVIFDLNWIPTSRGVKYYWLRLVRFFTR
jgi:hypothetical protein